MTDRMKRKLSETRPEPTAVISKSGVQSLVLNEVRRAVKVSEAKMESLLEKVQRLECEPKDDLNIRKMEVHIKKMKRRGAAAMAYVRKLSLSAAQTSVAPAQIALSSAMISGIVDLSRSDSDDVVEVPTPSLQRRTRRRRVSRESGGHSGVQVEPPILEREVKEENRPPRQPSPAPDPPRIKEEPAFESIAVENARREPVEAGRSTPGRSVGTPSPAGSGYGSSTSTLPPPGTAQSKVKVVGSKATAQISKMEVEPPSGDGAVKLDRRRPQEASSPDSTEPCSTEPSSIEPSTEPCSPASPADQLFIKEEPAFESIAAQNARRELVTAEPQRELVKAEPPSPTKTAPGSSTGPSSTSPSLPEASGTAQSKAAVDGSKLTAQRLSVAPPARTPDIPMLPATSFPSILPAAAASFSIPVKVELSLAYIQNPPQLTIMWNAAEKEAAAPPMDSYSVYMTMERPRGSGAFGAWNMISEVRALPLPMVILLKHEVSIAGRRLGFAVVGKDQFGRYGPYSDVKRVTLPD